MSQRFKFETPSSTAGDDNVRIDDLRERDNAERKTPRFFLSTSSATRHMTHLGRVFFAQVSFLLPLRNGNGLLYSHKKSLKMLKRLFYEFI